MDDSVLSLSLFLFPPLNYKTLECKNSVYSAMCMYTQLLNPMVAAEKYFFTVWLNHPANITEKYTVIEYMQWEQSAFECFQKKNAKYCLAKMCLYFISMTL